MHWRSKTPPRATYSLLCAVQMAYSTYYSIDILALKLIWRLALYGLSVQVSCLMVFTVHGIVPPSCCVHSLGLRRWKYIQSSCDTYPIRCKNHETTITCTCTQISECGPGLPQMSCIPLVVYMCLDRLTNSAVFQSIIHVARSEAVITIDDMT